MSLLPLIDRPADAALFLGPSGRIDAGRFLADAASLAARLPPGRQILNLCRDRYRFALTTAAALIAGRVSLLCGDPSHSFVASLLERYPDTATVGDADTDGPPGTRSAWPTIPGDRLAAIVFTSGSTGAPVAHEKRWAALVARTRAAADRFALTERSPAAIIGTIPPGHMYGLETTILLPFHAPCATWCGPAFFPADVQSALAAVPAPRILVTTPLQLRSLGAIAAPPLQTIISATAPLDPALAAEAEARWSTKIVEIFGATECGSIATRHTTATDAWTPYDGIRLHQTGTSPTVEAACAPDTPLADEIDLVADGTFRLLGRRADLVKLGGRRASLAGLNQILTGLEGVRDGIFVVPDDLDTRSNARLVALVVAPGRTIPGLLADLRGRIDPVFLPRRLIQVDALPRNSLGKLPRQAVLDLLRTTSAA